MKCIEKRNDVNVFEYNDGRYAGKSKINSLEAEGLIYRLYRWLNENGYEEEIEDVRNNASPIRNGNEIQLMDNYPFDGRIEISFLYSYNGTAWAVLYDTLNDRWYGEFEL